MGISGISSSSSASTGPTNVSIDSSIAGLQKQITQVQKEISDESTSRDDAKTKTQLVEAYTE